jgi:flavin-dependent dehydrogenase
MARDGLDVVLLERGNRPGEKNVMSGILITDKRTPSRSIRERSKTSPSR